MLQKQGFFSTLFLYRTQVNLSNIVDIRHFDELLLNNRQYLLNIVKEMDAFELLKDLNTV